MSEMKRGFGIPGKNLILNNFNLEAVLMMINIITLKHNYA